MKKQKVLNSNGAVVLMTVVAISAIMVMYVAIITTKSASVADQTRRVNESLRYIGVAEDLGQVIGWGLILGKTVSMAGLTCPPETAEFIKDGFKFCLPGVSASADTLIKKVCTESVDNPGPKYCLNNLSIVKNDQAKNFYPAPPLLSGSPFGSAFESSSSRTLNADYHREEPWFPKADDQAWSQNLETEIRTPSCTSNSQMVLGCMKCDYPGVTCIDFEICPATTGPVGNGCKEPFYQRIAIY